MTLWYYRAFGQQHFWSVKLQTNTDFRMKLASSPCFRRTPWHQLHCRTFFRLGSDALPKQHRSKQGHTLVLSCDLQFDSYSHTCNHFTLGSSRGSSLLGVKLSVKFQEGRESLNLMLRCEPVLVTVTVDTFRWLFVGWNDFGRSDYGLDENTNYIRDGEREWVGDNMILDFLT